jgi:hypothetical protein
VRPFADWLSARMTERRVGPRQIAIAMAAHGFRISRSAVSAYALDQVVPPMEKAEAFAAYFEAEEGDVLDLIRRSRSASGRGGTRATTAPGGDDATRDLIRLTVLETIEQMDRRRDRVPPESDPEIAAMVAEINAELARMTLPQIEEARRCFREELRRHRRAEGQRLQS